MRPLPALLIGLVLGVAEVQAADKFGQVIPPDTEALVDKARQQRLPFLDAYNPQASVKALESVVSSNPEYYRAWFNIGLAYYEVGDYEKSVKSFDRALKIRENFEIEDNTILNTAGWVALRSADFARAEELLKLAEEATRGEGTSTEKAVIANLGELYFLTQRFSLSKYYFKRYRDEFFGGSVKYYLDIIDKTQEIQNFSK